MRRLPIGIQDFERLRSNSHVYIDKTETIYNLVNSTHGACFLSRPRRFGKSLLCSTLKAIFEGKRELFQEVEGFPALAIDNLDWEWKKFPVIMLSLNVCDYNKGLEHLNNTLHNLLLKVAITYDLELRGNIPNHMFENLIFDLHRKYNQGVVVIIDEYDSPLLDSINNKELHAKIRDELKGFYGILKASDQYLRFTFITGVTKFSKISIFSDLNHLRDLSLSIDYAEICGWTHEEVEANFQPEIDDILQETEQTHDQYMQRLKDYYNGYRFTRKPTTVYNPFGLLNHFADRGQFSPYWYETATPTFLIKLIKEQKINILDIDKVVVTNDSFYRFDAENMDANVILYQAGYLTIVDYDDESCLFYLGYPNLEVSSALAKSLVYTYLETSIETADKLIIKLPSSFIKGDVPEVINAMQYFLAGVPYDIVKSTENYYQTFVHLAFSMLGLNCRSEVRVSSGRMDTLVETKKFVYCFEFKINESAEKALEQIEKNDYLLHWKGTDKKLFKIGVNFDTEKRNINDWKMI